MAGKLERTAIALRRLNVAETMPQAPDARALLLVALACLGFMLSVPLADVASLILYAVYPVVLAAWLGVGLTELLRRSWWALPVAAAVGMFNPMLDTQTAFTVGTVAVSRGWVSFVSILVRALVAVQVVVLLLTAHGFNGLCSALRSIGLPAFLTTQLAFVYRYITVLLQEALDMRRAREARSYGRPALPLRQWGAFIGQLFIRSVARAERIHKAMLARGFTGVMPSWHPARRHWTLRDTLFVAVWTLLFALLRFLPVPSLLSRLLT